MANYTNLLATVNAQIRANGNQEITGPVLNAVLKNLISVLGDGYRFKGVAAPADNPGTPDNRVFYIAGTPGTYANFGGLVVPDDGGAYLLTFDTVWAAAQLPAATTASVQAVATALADKVDKEEGKGLSSNDFTDAYKALLDSLQGGAFPGLFAGFTANLIDTRSNGVAQSFAFRKSGGDGVNYLKRIKGKTIVWNQLVDSGTTEVATISGHKYITRISGVDAIVTSSGASIAVADDTADNVHDITLMFGSGNEPSTVEEFRALFPLPYYDYNAGTLINNKAEALETVGFNQLVSQPVYYSRIPSFDKTKYTRVIKGLRYRLHHDALPVATWRHCYKAFDLNGVEITSDLFAYNSSTPYYGSLNIWIDGSNRDITEVDIEFACDCYIFVGFVAGDVSESTPMPPNTCLNISNTEKNGTYEPYWKRTLPLGLSSFEVTDGENVITVNGLKSAGSVYDEIDLVRKKYIKRIGEVDMGTLTWLKSTDFFYTSSLPVKTHGTVTAYFVCSKYLGATGSVSGHMYLPANSTAVRVYDDAYAESTAAAFKTAVTGTLLYYELATPVEYDLVNPITPYVEVDEDGTEKRLPEDTAAAPQAPFESDSNYSVSIANLTRKLAAL